VALRFCRPTRRTFLVAASGVWSLTKLPIDAVPDVTNVQVQINASAPALTPVEIEKQVTVALETAIAGIPGLESTRSFSRNGFAQITAVFADRTKQFGCHNQTDPQPQAQPKEWPRLESELRPCLGGRRAGATQHESESVGLQSVDSNQF
jgi:cobalt-zinc-cadmium resistance protein CzcA